MRLNETKIEFMERTDKFVAKLDKFDNNAFPDRYNK